MAVDRLTMEDGMPSNEVRQVYKGSQGFMWFATDRGLVRYNAYDFKTYQFQLHDSKSISDDELYSMLDNGDGTFWIGAQQGLNRFDVASGEFKRYYRNRDDTGGLRNDLIASLLKDSKGRLWVGTALGGLYLFHPETESFTAFVHDPANPQSLAGDRIKTLVEGPSGKIWVGRIGAKTLERFDPETREVEHFDIDVEPGNPNSRTWLVDIICMDIDSKGVVWFGTWDRGLYSYNPSTGIQQRFVNDPNDPDSLPSNIVQSIDEDENGLLWLGTRNGGLCVLDTETGNIKRVKLVWKTEPNATINTVLDAYWDPQGILWLGTMGDGVCRYDSNRQQIQYIKNDPKDPASLSNDRVFAVEAARDGTIWIGTDGGGLERYDPETEEFTHYLGEPGDPTKLETSTVISLLTDHQGRLWVGSWNSQTAPLAMYDPATRTFRCFPKEAGEPDPFSVAIVRSMCEDHEGVIWIGAESTALVEYDPEKDAFHYHKTGENGLKETTIRRVFEDHADRIWIATEMGLHYYDRESGRFHLFELESPGGDVLASCYVTTLFEDSKNNLWLGTDQGLYQLSSDRTRLQRYSTEDGLADDLVKSIEEDEDGYLWLSMENGKLTRFNPSLGVAVSYDHSDGLQNLAFTSNCSTVGAQGELYFGGLNGLNRIWPENITRNEYKPPIVITSFEVMGKTYPLQKELADHQRVVLNYDQNFISFEFAALNFTRSHKNQFAYRLVPLERDWNYCGSLRYARYTSLEPGDYEIQVKGSNNDLIWNEEGVSIPLTIRPPMWRTWWFQAALAGAIVLVAYLRYRDLRLQQRRLEREVARQTKELSEANQILERLSMQDGLTQVSNRRCFDRHIQNEWQRAVRNQTWLSLLFFDVDFFKKYNDCYDHVAGDDCLKKVARVLKNSARRPGDMAARFGGEEFVVLLAGTGADDALQFAEQLRAQIEDLGLPHETSGISPVVTVSAGVSSIIPDKTLSPDVLVKAADRGLYQAKENGRNQVSYFDPAHLMAK